MTPTSLRSRARELGLKLSFNRDGAWHLLEGPTDSRPMRIIGSGLGEESARAFLVAYGAGYTAGYAAGQREPDRDEPYPHGDTE